MTDFDEKQAGAVAPFSAGSGRPHAALPEGACDCHVHVYDRSYPASPEARLLPPDASASDYRLLQRRTGTSRAVFVTPSTYGADNRPMLSALREFGQDARGIAVIDGTETDAELEALNSQGVRGVRLNLSLGASNSIGMLEPIASRIANLGWHVQLLMSPDQLAGLGELLKRLPVQLVFDHFARLSPSQACFHTAHALVCALLSEERAWVKLSGGYIVSPKQRTEDPALGSLAKSYFRANPGRVVWGSDWPHATASAGLQPMPDDARQIDCLAAWVDHDAELFRRVLVDNACALYGFPAPISHLLSTRS